MLGLKEIYNLHKIKWNGFYAEFDDCQNESSITFDVMPKEYLRFAKNNLQKGCKQSRIDAMGNAKRAIEAQIDLLISTLGYDYKEFDKYSSYLNTKKFIKEKYQSEHHDGIAPRIKLLNILGLAPTLLIAEIRHLRNQMEHEYKVPSLKFVKKSVEVAELFINSSNYKLIFSPTEVQLSNNELDKDTDIYFNVGTPQIVISFDSSRCMSEVIVMYRESLKKYKQHKLKVDDEKYIECIELLFKEDIKLCPKIFEYDIESDYIKNLNYDD